MAHLSGSNADMTARDPVQLRGATCLGCHRIAAGFTKVGTAADPVRVSDLSGTAEFAHHRLRGIAPRSVSQVDSHGIAHITVTDRRNHKACDRGVSEARLSQHRRQPARVNLVEPVLQTGLTIAPPDWS